MQAYGRCVYICAWKIKIETKKEQNEKKTSKPYNEMERLVIF